MNDKHEEQLILVDRNDQPQGLVGKTRAHQEALLHRAFSVMIYNNEGELLIQKRADCKYHSAGLWANSCCGHPRNNETVKAGAERRLFEELGVKSSLIKVTEVFYCLELDNGMHEHEYTHVFSGKYANSMNLNKKEVSEVQWIKPKDLRQKMHNNPELYAEWLKFYLENYYENIFINIG